MGATKVEQAQAAERKIAEIARTRRPTEAEQEEARRAYAAAATEVRREARSVQRVATPLSELHGMKPTRFTCKGDHSPLVTDGKDLFCTAGCGRVVMSTLEAVEAMDAARREVRSGVEGFDVEAADDFLVGALHKAGVL